MRRTDGLGALGSALVILVLFAVITFGLVLWIQRDAALIAAEASSPPPVLVGKASSPLRSAEPIPTPQPTPLPGHHIVRRGETLFSIASTYGVSADELRFWNELAFPTLGFSPEVQAGWQLAVTGPALPTRPPQPTQPPRSTQPPTTLVIWGPQSFPASQRVTVRFYDVVGSTPQELHASITERGPYSVWLGTNAQAHVEPNLSYNFVLRATADGCVTAVSAEGPPVTASYVVVMPRWSPPSGVSSRTIEWWNSSMASTVSHEGHHIEIYEALLPGVNAGLPGAPCETAQEIVNTFQYTAHLQNCEYDLASYAAQRGYSLESCLAQ